MAGFLPSIEGLQKLLQKDDFKDKLEMAKMFKSQQVAQKYLPLLAEAKTSEEAAKIHQYGLAEAAQFGLNDLSPMLNSALSNKRDQLGDQEKKSKGLIGIQSTIDQYADNEMYNPFTKSWTTVSEFSDQWIGTRGQDPNVWMAKDEFKDIIESNLAETSYESGAAGGTKNPTIITVVTKKTKKGNIESKANEMWNYDLSSGKLFYDKNNDQKVSTDELAGAEVYKRKDVQDAMKSLRGEKETAVNNSYQADASARGWANVGIAGSYLSMAQEKHQVWKENVKNKYVPKAGDVKQAYDKAFANTVSIGGSGSANIDNAKGVWGKLRDYYKNSPQQYALVERMYNFGGMNTPNIGSEQLKNMSSSFRGLLDAAIKNTDLFYGAMTSTERDVLKQMYGALDVAKNIEMRFRAGQPLTDSDFTFTINNEGVYSPKVFGDTRNSYFSQKDGEIATQAKSLVEEGIITQEQATNLGWDSE